MSRLWIQRTLLVLAIMLIAGSAWAAGSSTSQDSQAVLERVRPLAEQGNANAQYNMGVIYDRGYGVERDYAKARTWYEKAAAQGYAKAAHNLGVMYQTGHGVAVDNERAAHWFKKAAGLGEPAAQNNLAVMYARGVGVQRNMGLAAAWAARAAQAGNSSAIANIPLITAELPQAVIDGDDVNIRSKPTTDATVLKQSDADTQVVLLQQRGDWSQVLFPSDYVIGWVADFLLTGATQTAAATPVPAATPAPSAPADTVATGQAEPAMDSTAAAEPTESDATVAAVTPPDAGNNAGADAAALAHKAIGGNVVNIREQPTTQATVLFQVHRGDRVTILKGRDGWKYIKLDDDGRTGWVAGFLLVDA